MKIKTTLLLLTSLVFLPGHMFAQNIVKEIRDCERIIAENKENDYDSILIFAERQYELATQLDDSIELGKAHLSLAYAHYNLGNDGKNLSSLIKARQIFKSVNNDSLYALATLEMASMYKEAISAYFQPDSLLHSTVKYFKEQNSDDLLARSYLELGLVFRNKYRSNISRDSIMYYYTKAKLHADRANNRELSGAITNNIADYYLLNPHKNLDTVIYLSKKIIDSPHNDLSNNAVAILNTSIALKEQGDPQYLKYLKEGHQLASKIRPERLMGQAAYLLYQYYQSNEQYDSAFYFYKQWTSSRSNRRNNYVLLLLESEMTDSKNVEQQNALLARNLSMQQNLNSALIFAFLILVIFIMMVVRNNSVIKKKNEDLRKEKEHNARLLKEIHHRVKNNLQMIVGLLDLQQSSTIDHDVSLVLNDAGSRVKSIALIHQSLYKGDTDMVSIGFDKYIAELCDSLVYSYNMGEKLDVDLDIDEIIIPFNRAVILGLLITELVTNVLKHAFVERTKGSLNISIKKTENEVRLIVSDDGVGIPDEFDQSSSSFGLDLINSFVGDLGGEIKFSNGKGTKVEVILTDLDLK